MCSTVLLFFVAASAMARTFDSPIDVPATPSLLAARAPLIGVTRAGHRIVAVGLRGDIVYSDDEGRTWAQAKVPVSTDLVAVSFPDAKRGWAVGHGGVVIHTDDGGATWVKQVDGRRLSELAVNYYKQMLGDSSSVEVKRAFRDAKALASDGSSEALLDVFFESEKRGFIVGTFNRIFRTEDGGKTWIPWMERTGNPDDFHFYSVHGDGERILLTGEHGMVWKLNRAKGIFEPRPTPYKGTLFGSLESGNDVVVYGMRGSLFQSSDGCATWKKVEVPNRAGITGGVVLADGAFLLVNQAGIALLSRDGGNSFETVKLARPMSYFGAGGFADGNVALVGADGVVVETVPQFSHSATHSVN
ncbi:Ycf48-like protein [Paraburkholderia rhynchosiae]|uniref:Ycf48-like protein n=3 Tax=Paraburkholderia rhynchosiae TaxID=487049 RepID=A0A6J5CJV5_9BURK|nr:Ycf48-like protein [Paraburkholderia rhynchosiae]